VTTTMNKSLNGWVAVIALATIGLGTCGCPALMIPSLAYQGYKYEKTGSLPGMPSSSASGSNTKSEKKASPERTPSPDEIE
jgi:hypothetical protein